MANDKLIWAPNNPQPPNAPSTAFAGQQILHIKTWYKDGSQREINITSPHVFAGEDLEVQYIYMKMYLRKMGSLLGITAYQGHICCVENGVPRIVGTFEKVDFSTIPPLNPGQYWEYHE